MKHQVLLNIFTKKKLKNLTISVVRNEIVANLKILDQYFIKGLLYLDNE